MHIQMAWHIEMSSSTTNKTITELHKMFAACKLPVQLVSDNRPQFMAEQFANFMQANGIKHIKCAPASIGAVECLV